MKTCPRCKTSNEDDTARCVVCRYEFAPGEDGSTGGPGPRDYATSAPRDPTLDTEAVAGTGPMKRGGGLDVRGADIALTESGGRRSAAEPSDGAPGGFAVQEGTITQGPKDPSKDDLTDRLDALRERAKRGYSKVQQGLQSADDFANPLSGRTRKRLLVFSTGSNVTAFPLRGDEVVVGRSDPVTGTFPDVDLTPFAGSGFVSRRHLKIISEDDGYAIIPIGRALTRLDTKELPAHKWQPVQPGETIIVGDVIALVIDEG